jgi:hypothetical protein
VRRPKLFHLFDFQRYKLKKAVQGSHSQLQFFAYGDVRC